MKRNLTIQTGFKPKKTGTTVVGSGLKNQVTLMGQPTKGSTMMYGKGVTYPGKRGKGYQL